MSEAILRIEKLKKSFGPREVLRQIDMEIMPGEVALSHRFIRLREINTFTVHQPT